MPITHHSTQIDALIADADDERWQSWHGPDDERDAHAMKADALLEQLRRIGVEWAKEIRGC